AGLRRPWDTSIETGSEVRFADDGNRWWKVRARDDRYVVLTRQANFQPKGVLYYTIIDWEAGFRGPSNEIGQGWGDGTFTESECRSLLDALIAGERSVSWRNRVRV